MKALWILTLVTFAWGMSSHMILGGIYGNMMNDIGESKSKNPLIKQIRLKYDNCCKLDIAVNNVDVFVEKLIENYRVCGLSLNGWKSMSKIMSYLCVISGVINAIVYRESFQMVTFGLGIATLSALGIKIVGQVIDVDNQKRMVIVNLVDYLENTSAHRNSDREEVIHNQKLSRSASSEFNKLNKSYEKIEASSGKIPLDERVLEEIIEEYLT